MHKKSIIDHESQDSTEGQIHLIENVSAGRIFQSKKGLQRVKTNMINHGARSLKRKSDSQIKKMKVKGVHTLKGTRELTW